MFERSSRVSGKRKASKSLDDRVAEREGNHARGVESHQWIFVGNILKENDSHCPKWVL